MVAKAPEASAVEEAVRLAASEQEKFYSDCGALEWSRDQAEEDADASIRALEVFLEIHRLSAPFDRDRLHRYWSDLWLSGRFVPLAKWATSVPLAALSGYHVGPSTLYRELPPPPAWLAEKSYLKALFPGQKRLQTVLRTRLGEVKADGDPTDRALRLSWSLLGAKGMFPALWVDALAKSLQEHSELLGKTPPPLPPRSRELLQLIARGVSKLAYGRLPSPIPLSQLARPKLSMRSGFVKVYDQTSRRWRTMEGTRAAQYSRLGGRATEELTTMLFDPKRGVTEIRSHPYQFDWKDWDFDPRVDIVALQEPFKIRTISVADGPVTAVSTSLQKAWHSAMRQLRPFQLIGGVPVREALTTLHTRDLPWVSGDYSAATDRLSSHATREVFDVLTESIAFPSSNRSGTTHRLRDRIATSLMAAELDYSKTLSTFKGRVPDGLLRKIPLPERTLQRNGQLMGNVLSFPILCIINLATFLEAFLECEEPLPFDYKAARLRGYLTTEDFQSLDVLVNGDDILFQAAPLRYEAWLKVTARYGFKPSVGKNYYSDRFFTVNSELYKAPRVDYSELPTFERVQRPWWAGFMTDMVSVQKWAVKTGAAGDYSSDLRMVLSTMQQSMRDSVPEADWPLVNRLWVGHLHKSGLLHAYSGLNWFLPVGLGGLGLEPSGFEVKVTYAQRKLAIRLSLDPEGSERFPLSGAHRTTTRALRTLREHLGGIWMKGELIRTEQGRTYVLDKEDPGPHVEVGEGEAGEPYYLAHPTVDTLVRDSKLVDNWLDFHLIEGTYETEQVERYVSRWLRWGLQVSDKRLPEFTGLDFQPRYLCGRKAVQVLLSDVKKN